MPQGERQKFARTFRKVRVNSAFFWHVGISGGVFGPLKEVENSGEGKSYHKAPPKTVLGPLTYDTIYLEGTGTDQTNPSFWALQNEFWRAPRIARYVLPPPLRFPNWKGSTFLGGEKSISINNFSGNLFMCCLLLGGERKHITNFPGNLRKMPGQSRDYPGTIPWNICFCVFLFMFRALLTKLTSHDEF